MEQSIGWMRIGKIPPNKPRKLCNDNSKFKSLINWMIWLMMKSKDIYSHCSCNCFTITFCPQVAFLQQRELCGLLRKDWDLTVLWLIGDKNTTCDVDAHYLVDNYAWYPILHLKARSNPHKKPWSYSNSWSRINSCSDCRMKPFFERRLKTSGALFTWETIHCERVMYRFLVNLHQICIYSSSSLRYERDLVGNNVCSQRRRDRGKGRLAT